MNGIIREGKLPIVFHCILLTLISLSSIAKEQPNILFILSDDAGYADFGFQGSSEMKTPSLDALAKQSIRFEQAYVSAATCGPSRAGLYTGKYQQRFGFEENNVPGYMSQSGLPEEQMGLPLDQKTLANYLQDLGYTTALFGKWHQGDADKYHPLKRGFDEFVGFRSGARSYYELTPEQIKTHPKDQLERGFGKIEKVDRYLTDLLADEAIRFIQQPKKAPFMAMLSFNAVHTPMEVKTENLALFPQLSGKRQQLAAMTYAMDLAIGRVLQSLADSDIENDTLVIYTNDNGGPSDTNHSNNYPLSGSKANHLEGGIRVPMLMRWPNKFAANSSYAYPVSLLDFLPTFVDVAGGNSKSITDIDGVSLLSFLTGETKSRPHQTLYWKKENRGAIRDMDWKLLRFPDRPAELYNIHKDISEQHNLASQHPEKVQQLFQQLFAWELTLERPLWQLQRQYEGAAMRRMDQFRDPQAQKKQ